MSRGPERATLASATARSRHSQRAPAMGRCSKRGARIARLGVFVVGVVVASSTSREAMAFCRSTTCDDSRGSCKKDANGCVVEGAPVSWKSSTLVFHLHDRGTSTLVRGEARQAIRAAFHTWSDVLCPGNLRTRLRFVEGEDISIDPYVERDSSDPTRKLNGVFFRDESWPYPRSDDTTLASTFRLYGDKSCPGCITSARIEINTAEARFALPDDGPGDPDLITVMTHEVGHFIGIAHSREKDAIMMAGLCRVGNRCSLGKRAERRLAPDDIAAVCALYPPGEPDALGAESGAAPTEASGAGCSVATGRAPAEGLVGSLSLLAVVVGRLRRRLGLRRRVD